MSESITSIVCLKNRKARAAFARTARKRHNLYGLRYPYGSGLTASIGDDWKQSAYYDIAEEWTDGFWDKGTVFRRGFDQLDVTNVVELACGHGRHVPKYIEHVGRGITLVDINQENLDFCQRRFGNETKIRYSLCCGNNFADIQDASQTAIFCYDAMVHFELLDIAAYLKDANRILVGGGKIWFHHSNAMFSPGVAYYAKPHGRNFMSGEIFAHLAIRMGFKVLEQHVIDWGDKDLDCVSLCEKIHSLKI